MRHLDDGDVPFRMPDSWYDPPEGEPYCPQCKASDASVAVTDAVADALHEFGVIVGAIDDLWLTHDGERFLLRCTEAVAMATKRDGGHLCLEHNPANED